MPSCTAISTFPSRGRGNRNLVDLADLVVLGTALVLRLLVRPFLCAALDGSEVAEVI